MISQQSFYLTFQNQSKTYYASWSTIQLPKGGYYLVMKKQKTTAVIFEMIDQDKITGSFRLKTIQNDTLQPLYLSIEPVSPNTLFLSPLMPQSIRYRWTNKKFECVIQHDTSSSQTSSINQSSFPFQLKRITQSIQSFRLTHFSHSSKQLQSSDATQTGIQTQPFQSLGELYPGKQTKEGTFIVVNSAQQFIFKKIKEDEYIIGTYAEAFKSLFYFTFMNEIPNIDIIPGSPYFRVNVHRNIKHAASFQFIKGKIGYKIHIIENKSPTVKYVFNNWWIKVRENEYQSELVYCDESEADEFVFNGRRIEVVQNGKCINYIGIGDKRDDESYFLTLYPIDLLKLSLDVKFICVLDEEIL